MNANLSCAIQSLKESRQRALLSGSGVAVASMAIILLMSIGLGVEKDVKGQVEDLGVNLLIVVPGHVDMASGFNPNLGGQSWFKEHHAQDLKAISGIRNVAMLTFAGGGVRYQNHDAYPMVIACTPSWFEIRKVEMLEGRNFQISDGAAKEVVLGQTAKEILFKFESALQKTVTINGQEYHVVGVTKEKLSGQSMFNMQSFQNVAYIPMATMKAISPNMQIDRIIASSNPEVNPKNLVSSLESVLGKTLDRQQYSVLTQEDLLGLIYQVIGILSTLVIGLTAIGLFVGGIGVMTVMLMSVGERKKEIGIRKAAGATHQDIFLQFLMESATIGFAGVVFGLCMSLIVCALLEKFTAIKPLVTFPTIVLTLLVGLGLGCVFGVWPAIRASKLDPIESLRLE